MSEIRKYIKTGDFVKNDNGVSTLKVIKEIEKKVLTEDCIKMYNTLPVNRKLKRTRFLVECSCGNLLIYEQLDISRSVCCGQPSCPNSVYSRKHEHSISAKSKDGTFVVQNYQVEEVYSKAIQRKIDANGVTAELIVELFEKNNGRCPITGVKLLGGKDRNWSLDRIDSSIKTYKDNCQLVLNVYNMAKNNRSDFTMKALALRIVQTMEQQEIDYINSLDDAALFYRQAGTNKKS